ncbi:MAG: GlmU family protein [Catalinimonas sp.]
MSYAVFDDPAVRDHLRPFTDTRPVGHLRTGILTQHERWERYLDAPCSHLTQPYLAELFPFEGGADTCFVNGAVCATAELADAVQNLSEGEALRTPGGTLPAARTDRATFEAALVGNVEGLKEIPYQAAITIVSRPWHLFKVNAAQIAADFDLLTAGRTSAPLDDPHTAVYAPERVFLEPGATVRAAVLNAEAGPIYLGKNAHVQEGSLLQGPLTIGEGAVVNMGAKLRGGTTVGPYCKVGGEISSSVLIGYSNKGHDGFLGHSVLGEWCNLGADTNTSNLKNTYGPVRVWSHAEQRPVDTAETFCGLLAADHVKAGINTMFNTGTVAGVGANVFGAGFPPKHIAAFAWGGEGRYDPDKFMETAARVMSRRKVVLTDAYARMLRAVWEATA